MQQRLSITAIFVTVLLLAGLAFAQDTPIDFEPGGIGASWTWEVFENDDNPPLEILANPDPTGGNTSATVAKFTARVSPPSQPYAGTVTRNITPFTLDSTNSTVKIMVWKSVISDVGIKFEANFASTGEIKVPNTLVNQWEELTFDFSGKIGEPSSSNIDGLVVFPDFDGRGQENIIYFDNITFSAAGTGSGGSEPTVAAPTPTHPASDVISLFSNAYTDVAVDTWSASWDNADVADVQVAGDDAKLYTNLIFAGIEFTTQTVDASAMSHFHTDIWTPDPTALPAVFKIKLVDFGGDGAFGGGDDSEHELTFDANSNPPLVTGQWVSFDIPLSDFTGLLSTGHLAQMIIVGDPGPNTVYVDNVYFYASSTGIEAIGGALPSDFRIEQNYPNPFNPSTKIRFSLPQANRVKIAVYDILGREVTSLLNQFVNAGAYELTFDAAGMPSGVYLYSIQAGSFSEVKKMMLLK